jgi:signal transduction histidine kinase/CheY-like chemotaxis protein
VMKDKHAHNWQILYVEDDEEDYIQARNMLAESRQRKIQLTWAATFEEGAQKMSEYHFDAVLVDYNLGGWSGIELIREHAPLYPAPLILYTGIGSPEVDLEAMEAGAALYLTKDEANPLLLERAIRYAIQLKQRERGLESAAKRDTYLLKLSDALRPLSDPMEIQSAAERILGKHLGTNQVHYVETVGDVVTIHQGYSQGTPPMVGTFRLHHIGQELVKTFRSGRTAVCCSVATDPTISEAEKVVLAGAGIQAYIAVPLVKDGEWIATLAAQSIEPRDWTPGEVQLVEETAERTWAAVERAQAEAAMRASEEKYRTLFNSIDEGFCIIEVLFDENERPVDYRFLEVNEMFEQQTGIQNGVGRLVREFIPHHEEHWFEIYGQIAKTGEAKRFENVAEQIHRYYDVFAFRIGRPEEHKVAVLFKDIAEKKRQEQDLQHYAKELERSNQALAEFTFIASHDLQEPLRKIKSFAHILETRCSSELGEEGQDYLARVMSASERMQGLLQGLLEYSRVSSQGEQFTYVDLNRVIAQVCSDLEGRILDTGGKITVTPLPLIQGNPMQIRQLFQNLLGNALKYHRPDLPPQVRVTGGELGNHQVEISVQDNGIGFDPQQADRLFAPFTRLHAKSAYDGVGMGLAICSKIVERHGGTIRAEGNPGQGATFLVRLPSNSG